MRSPERGDRAPAWLMLISNVRIKSCAAPEVCGCRAWCLWFSGLGPTWPSLGPGAAPVAFPWMAGKRNEQSLEPRATLHQNDNRGSRTLLCPLFFFFRYFPTASSWPSSPKNFSVTLDEPPASIKTNCVTKPPPSAICGKTMGEGALRVMSAIGKVARRKS